MGDKAINAKHMEPTHQAERPATAATRDVMPLSLLPGVERALLDPGRAQSSDLLVLQRAAGNRAVSGLIQAKLTVGAANDQYEQEADRAAERVVSGEPQAATAVLEAKRSGSRRPQGVQRQEDEDEVQTKPLAAGITPLVQRQEDEDATEVQTKPLIQRQEDEDATEVQTKPLVQRRADGSFDAGPEIENRLSALRGGGSALPGGVRARMEQGFGADFSAVRLHTGAEAAQMNTRLRAQAFTHGSDIYLGAGQYEPGTSSGKRLLAHELTHVVQQGKATAQRRIVGSISRRPVVAIQRGKKLEAVKKLAKAVTGGITSAGKAMGRAISGAGSSLKEKAKMHIYDPVSSAVPYAAGKVKEKVKDIASTVKEKAEMNIYDPVSSGVTYLAGQVAGKIKGAYLGTRDIIEPLGVPDFRKAYRVSGTLPSSMDPLNSYAGHLLDHVEGHSLETQRNTRFLQEDQLAIDHALDVALEELNKKKLARNAVKAPTGRIEKLRKGSAEEQRQALDADVASLTVDTAQMKDEQTKVNQRKDQAEAAETELAETLGAVRGDYTEILVKTKAGHKPAADDVAFMDRMATVESDAAAKRNKISTMVNEVRIAGRGERLITGVAKTIGAAIVNFGLQTVTLGIVGLESKDRPGGYSSGVRITTQMGKWRAEFARLREIASSTLYANSGLSKVYALFKGLSTMVIVPLRNVISSVGLLSTIIGSIVGAATLGAGAAPFVMASTICTYAAIGLTALNALINTALAIVNAVRINTLTNKAKRSKLRGEVAETTTSAITENISVAMSGVNLAGTAGAFSGLGLQNQLTGGTYSWQDKLSGQAFYGNTTVLEKLAMYSPMAATTGANVLAGGLTPKIGEKVSPANKLWQDATYKDLTAQAYLPGGYNLKVGSPRLPIIGQRSIPIPAPNFIPTKAIPAIKQVGNAIGGKATEFGQFSQKEFHAATKYLGESVDTLKAKFDAFVKPVVDKASAIRPHFKKIADVFRDIKAKFSKSPEGKPKGSEGQDADELLDGGIELDVMVDGFLSGTGPAVDEGKRELEASNA